MAIHEFADSLSTENTFHLGISLHSCGVLTDAALALCLRNRAAFCLCPCCYGQTASNLPPDYLPRSQALQELHTMSTPQPQTESSSKERRRRRKLQNTKPFYMVARSADCTSAVDSNFCDTQNFILAKRCMQIVDADRLLWAAQHHYSVCMSSLRPFEVTPKNNVILGMPGEQQQQENEEHVVVVDMVALAASAGENADAEAGEKQKTGQEQFRKSTE
jgi:hypothetical protein